MLGQRLVKWFGAKRQVELYCCSVENESVIPDVNYQQLDIGEKKQVKKIFSEFYPDVVINAAAYTNVDGCESNKETAWKINVTGVENIAKYSLVSDAHFIHISTDYVFDGTDGPYDENAKPNPISYYGRTKLAGENAILSSKVKNTIVRTNVLYGVAKYGRPDFVKWVVNSLRNGQEIRIVSDQINNPTFIDDLVQSISKMIDFDKTGIYNIAGKELMTRYEFVIKIADYFELDTGLISKILTKDLNQPAPRPLKSGLIILKAVTELGYKPTNTTESFRLMKKELNL